MSDRKLHPVQQQYRDVQDKIACLEIAMLPMKNEMKQLKKQLREAEKPLVACSKSISLIRTDSSGL